MSNRFFIERKEDTSDFPFYNNQPRKISTAQWGIILAIFFIGFLLSSFWVPNINKNNVLLVLALISSMKLIFGVGGLAIFAGKDTFTLFKKIRAKDYFYLFLLLIVDLIYAFASSGIVGLFTKTASNPAGVSHTEGSEALAHFLLNMISNIPNLLGEEFMALLPFLAILYFFYQRVGWSRNKSIAIALLLSSLIFGLLHLPTYQWNWAQVIFVVGLGRVMGTAAYIRTKSIWGSFLIHYLFDTLTFLLVFLA